MKNAVQIPLCWYEEIEDRVENENPYFFRMDDGAEWVEVDVNMEQFTKVSKELGWIIE